MDAYAVLFLCFGCACCCFAITPHVRAKAPAPAPVPTPPLLQSASRMETVPEEPGSPPPYSMHVA
jgi:hypothetical protein